MSGGTDAHGAIAMWIGAALVAALKGRDCWVMSSDVKIYAAGEMYYPDVSVTCGLRKYHSANRTVVANPILIVEVLSPSTVENDRGDKLRHYQQIESLQACLLVSQHAPEVELFSRGENGQWDYSAVAGLASRLEIPCLSISLALADIFDQIDFDQTN